MLVVWLLRRVWEEKATEVLRKVRSDVTRHRYGDDAHLDTTLEQLGLVMPGKVCCQLPLDGLGLKG